MAEITKKVEIENRMVIRFLLLSPFFLTAMFFSFIAGLIGGNIWHVGIILKRHEGENNGIKIH